VANTSTEPATTEPATSSHASEDKEPPLLVPLDVSRAKLDDELAQWQANAEAYRRRGWFLLSTKGLQVEIAFVTNIPFGAVMVPIVPVAVRLNYDNYDLWPPSLTFIDPRTRQPSAPIVQAIEQVNGEPRNALLVHPMTGRLFLCIPGLREYHTHPQHTGDDWLLHRGRGPGRLAVVCDTIWRRMVRNVIGPQVAVQFLPGAQSQLSTLLAQGDVDAVQSLIPKS
jgi:hypothetical protein